MGKRTSESVSICTSALGFRFFSKNVIQNIHAFNFSATARSGSCQNLQSVFHLEAFQILFRLSMVNSFIQHLSYLDRSEDFRGKSDLVRSKIYFLHHWSVSIVKPPIVLRIDNHIFFSDTISGAEYLLSLIVKAASILSRATTAHFADVPPARSTGSGIGERQFFCTRAGWILSMMYSRHRLTVRFQTFKGISCGGVNFSIDLVAPACRLALRSEDSRI